ncbi:IS3 family transposase [Lachnoanaerobaculum gingivalis]|uniref:IS3 family transposase n=1 Tax=Lachnoanaerobaculum gingivalis TaxID=2490855 RepID=A0A3P3QVI5_9FIRM|nr:IS3 family transposase [Lachnoanaerobaculum gingivalis]RRJ25272.1 IS3 family transposase [Lachnoanaerobaculum gingivalis]
MYTEVSAKVEATKVSGHRVSTSGMLKFLGVSRFGYCSFLNRKISFAIKRKEAIKKNIRLIYDASKQNYGAPKITKELRKSGETIAERTVGKYMREMGIKAQWIKPFTTTTRDSDFSTELTNILDERFNPERTNAVWCTDITYIWTQNGFVYLNCVMDLFARKIIAWTLSATMEVSTVVATIDKAKTYRNTESPLIIHSDRGSQYVSNAWCEATKTMQRSYSRCAYPYDNACIESFHSFIKREWLNRFSIQDYSHAYRLIFEYIEAFYNTVRIHSHCDYMSPDEFEKLYNKVHVLPAS